MTPESVEDELFFTKQGCGICFILNPAPLTLILLAMNLIVVRIVLMLCLIWIFESGWLRIISIEILSAGC
jgi:hypothetical protein